MSGPHGFRVHRVARSKVCKVSEQILFLGNYLFRAEMSFVNEPAVDFAAALGQVQTALEARQKGAQAQLLQGSLGV